MKKFLQFLALILRRGTLRHSGHDFNTDRAKSLESLDEFNPRKSSPHKLSSQTAKKSRLKNAIGQAAFIKASLRDTGGHLTARNLAYIRMPKSANTSISYAMLTAHYPQLAEKKPDETQINFLADVNLKPVSESGDEIFFTVVRNPFARLVSVYRDFFETDQKGFMYGDYLFGILPKTISFEEFVSRVSRIPDRLKDQHIRPQHLFLQPYENKGIGIRLIKLEEAAVLRQFLAEHEMELTHLNKSKDAYDYTVYFTSQTLQAAYSIYKTDVEKFGYGQVYEILKQAVSH